MKTFIATIAFLFMAQAWAPAQNAENHFRAQGYFFVAPILRNFTYGLNPAYYGTVFASPQELPADIYIRKRGGANVGFGGELFVYKGLGLGVEMGYAGPDWSFGRYGMGVGSVDVSYHFLPKRWHSKVEPFLTEGYSLYYGHGETNGLNFGGGVNWWLRKHVGLRLEVRDHTNAKYIADIKHFVAFRVGMTFR